MESCEKSHTKELELLIEQRRYFRLREKLSEWRHDLPEFVYLLYSGFCASAFNEPERSNVCFDKVFDRYAEHLDAEMQGEIRSAQALNALRSFRYRESAALYEQICLNTAYVDSLEDWEKVELANSRNLLNALVTVPAQQVVQPPETSVPFSRNAFNHLEVAVSMCGIQADFMLDSGANFCTVPESFAQQSGLRWLDCQVRINTATSQIVHAQLAVGESLQIGEITVRNVVFLVLPDEQLTFPEFGFSINGVIGFPVLQQLGELGIARDHRLTIVAEPILKTPKNMCLDGMIPVVELVKGDLRLDFILDTGANTTELSQRYFEAHHERIGERLRQVRQSRGGGGGVIETEAWEMDGFDFSIAGKPFFLPRITINRDNLLFLKYKDGNLGQDAYMQHDEMKLNLRDMYLDFRNIPPESSSAEAVDSIP